jgi:hypothetical protein
MSVGRVQTVSTLTPATAQFGGASKPLDLIDLASVKCELDIASTATDAWLSKVITRRSEAIHRFCNRVLLLQTYVENVFGFHDPYPWQLPGRMGPLQLANWPIAAAPSPSGTAPPLAASLSNGGASSLAARVYSVRLSYLTASGETAGGPPARIALPANGLCTVAGPGADRDGLATGYNVYAATQPGAETLQNASPIAVDTAWTEPASGLVAGATLPPYVLVAENVSAPYAVSPLAPLTLAEGRDFLVNAEVGQIERLDFIGRPRPWNAVPTQVIYPAGYTAETLPSDIEDAIIQLVKARWFARTRDPMIRSQNVEGVYSANYALGAGLGSDNDLPVDVQGMLERYRQPVIA